MKTDLLKITVIAVVLAACIVLFQALLFPALTLVLFVGITVTFTAGADRKKFPNYLLSISCGVAWGVLFHYMEHWATALGWNESVAMFAVFAVFTFAVKSTHNVFLKNSWANIVGFAFAGVIGVVYGGIEQIFPVLTALLCGVVSAVLSVWVSELLIKTPATAEAIEN